MYTIMKTVVVTALYSDGPIVRQPDSPTAR